MFRGAAAATFLLAACGGTTGGSGVVYVSTGDAGGDAALSDDATPTEDAAPDALAIDADAGVADTPLLDVPGVTDIAADQLEPTDTQLADGFAPELPVPDSAVADILTPDVPALDVAAPDVAGVVACKSDVACKATNQVCDIGGGVCVDCNTAADCKSPQVCTAHKCVIEQKCTSSKECPFVCNKAAGLCVECLSNSDCFGGTVCGADFACHTQAKVCSPGTTSCVMGGYASCKADGSGFSATVTSCDDANVCTVDSCKADVMGNPCVNMPITGNCEDGNLCTIGEQCLGGLCWNGQTISCDDKDACTTDSCDSTKGCVHDPIPGCGGPTCGQDANNTCNGKCGQSGGLFGGCSCASDCKSKNNCCADYDACGCSITTTPTCGQDPSNTCKGKCSTTCLNVLCQLQPGLCPPDWQACCP